MSCPKEHVLHALVSATRSAAAQTADEIRKASMHIGASYIGHGDPLRAAIGFRLLVAAQLIAGCVGVAYASTDTVRALKGKDESEEWLNGTLMGIPDIIGDELERADLTNKVSISFAFKTE